jgi:hypothetical protein
MYARRLNVGDAAGISPPRSQKWAVGAPEGEHAAAVKAYFATRKD